MGKGNHSISGFTGVICCCVALAGLDVSVVFACRCTSCQLQSWRLGGESKAAASEPGPVGPEPSVPSALPHLTDTATSKSPSALHLPEPGAMKDQVAGWLINLEGF